MDSSQKLRLGVRCDVKEFVQFVPSGQFKLGLETDSLVRMAKEFDQKRDRMAAETVAEESTYLETCFRFAKNGVIHRPNATKFVGLPLAIPICNVH